MQEIEPIDVTLKSSERKVISLNGSWEVFDTDITTEFEALPAKFTNTMPVPGLWDMAMEKINGNAVWYKKTFAVSGTLPDAVTLKISKAFWGKYIYLNGKHIADHQPNFTPAYVDITDHVLGDGQENVLLIKIGARDTQSRDLGLADGADFEKKEYIPGIYDDVLLIFNNNPFIQYIQTAPHVNGGTVTVQATLVNQTDKDLTTDVSFSVMEAAGRKPVGEARKTGITVPANKTVTCSVMIGIDKCRLWSPENPFLYEAAVQTSGDSVTTRFGMRDFRFDRDSGLPMLNNKPYYLRGTNITMYRFFEDPIRGSLPWDREWAIKVLSSFKRMNMNSIRYCIGFPPEIWYELADEMGFLIEDEYPIWYSEKPDGMPVNIKDTMMPEVIDWINERANHPCVVIWDIQNETNTYDTAIVIHRIREMKLDLSDRPWDNGWGPPACATDPLECHPYFFVNPKFVLSDVNKMNPDPAVYTSQFFTYTQSHDASRLPNNPRIINEYSWLWLNRDGTPTTLTRELYGNLLPGSTTRQRRDYYAKAVAQLTEFWRYSRKTVGIMEFCGLTYSKEGGATCDNYLPDIQNPMFDPLFEKMVSDAFASVGIIIEDWSETQVFGQVREFKVTLVNDLDREWAGEVTVALTAGDTLVSSSAQTYSVAPAGKTTKTFAVEIPITGTESYRLAASYPDDTGKSIMSIREFKDGEPTPFFKG